MTSEGKPVDIRYLFLTETEFDVFVDVADGYALDYCYSVEVDGVYVYYDYNNIDTVADIYFAISALNEFEASIQKLEPAPVLASESQ